MAATLGRLISSYEALLDAFQERAQELEISREGIDSAAGWADGYASKLLYGASAKRRKLFGPLSLGLMLETLGLKMILVEDPEATAKTRARRTPVNAHQQRFGNANASRLTPKLLEAPQQVAGPPTLTIVHNRQRRGKYS